MWHAGREPFKIRHIKIQKCWFEGYRTWRVLWLWVSWSPSRLHYFSHFVQLQQRRPSSQFAFWTSGLGLVCLKCRPTTRPLHWSSASAKVSVNFLSVGDFELGGRDILKRCLSFLCFSRWNRRRDETQAAVRVHLWFRRIQAQTSGSEAWAHLYKLVSATGGAATHPHTVALLLPPLCPQFFPS